MYNAHKIVRHACFSIVISLQFQKFNLKCHINERLSVIFSVHKGKQVAHDFTAKSRTTDRL